MSLVKTDQTQNLSLWKQTSATRLLHGSKPMPQQSFTEANYHHRLHWWIQSSLIIVPGGNIQLSLKQSLVETKQPEILSWWKQINFTTLMKTS